VRPDRRQADGMNAEGETTMKQQVVLVAAALGLVACAMFSRTDPPKVTLEGVEPFGGEGQEAGRMQLKLRVQNPNETPIDYNGVYVELDVQNKSLASGVSNRSGTVPAFGEAVVSVPVTVSYFGIAGQAMGLLSGKSFSKVSYELSGKLNSTTSGAVPFKSQGEVNLADLVGGGK
jgi:LEA14-like dessication related protein